MFFINFKGFVKPQPSLGSLILNHTNYVLCFYYKHHLNSLYSLYSSISNVMQHVNATVSPLEVLQSIPCSDFVHVKPVTFSSTYQIH